MDAKSDFLESTRYFEYPLFKVDKVVGADDIGIAIDCPTRRVYYLHELCKHIITSEGSKLVLFRSHYQAFMWAKARANAKFSAEEGAFADMHLAVSKGAALMKQATARNLRLQDLAPAEIACCADVYGAAISAAEKVLMLRGG